MAYFQFMRLSVLGNRVSLLGAADRLFKKAVMLGALAWAHGVDALAQTREPSRETVPAAAGIKQDIDGFDQRVQGALGARRGKPLVRARNEPPLAPGRGNYVRAYSFSVVEFATRCFLLGEQIPEANAALVENAQHYLEHPADIHDRDSFHWHSEMLLRLVELFGTKGLKTAGRMGPEAAEKVMAVVWEYAKQCSKVSDADVERSRTWHVAESENHHLQIITTS
jgi:hypothetical protein